MWPCVDVSAMLAEDISRISLPVDMKEVNNLRRDGFTYPMVQQCIVTFVQLGVWYRLTGDHTFVVSKHV